MRETTITTDKNNFVFPPRKPRSDRGDVVFTSCSRCFPIDTQAIRNKILDLAMRGKLTEQLPEDGTAEELYRRIQQEKQTLVKAGKLKKDKPLPEIAETAIPFDIPNSWAWLRWGNVSFQIQYGYNAPAKDKGRIRMVRITDIQDNKVAWNSVPFCDIDEDTIPEYRLYPNNILFARTGGTVGKSFLVEEVEKEAVFAGYLIRTSFSANISAQYMKYFMESRLYWKQLQDGTTATAQPNCNAKTLSRMIVPFPPLPEQHRIVEKIDQAFSLLDTIDTLQAQYADNLTVLKTKLLEAAIQGKLTTQLPEDGTAEYLYRQIQSQKQALIQAGKLKKEKPLPEIMEDGIPFEIPSNWKWVVLGNITSKISSGNTPTGGRNSDVYVPSGFPFFREQNIYDDGIHQAGMVFISEQLLATRQNSTVKAKDILLNITGGSIGRCALVPDDFDRGSINQHILIIRAMVPETRHYLHMLICSPYIQSQIKNNAIGDKDGFSAGRCKRLLVPLPPLAEQKRIVQKIDEAMKVFEN